MPEKDVGEDEHNKQIFKDKFIEEEQTAEEAYYKDDEANHAYGYTPLVPVQPADDINI